MKKVIVCVDVFLIVLAINLLIFCCDLPVFEGFELYNHTGKGFMYDISMTLLTTIFIYFLQKKYMNFTRRKKYMKVVVIHYMDVVNCIKEMVFMITRQIDYLNVNGALIKNALDKVDIDEVGSGKYENSKELTLREAILQQDRKMLYGIDAILLMPFLDEDLRDMLYELRTLNVHRNLEKFLTNADGRRTTIKQEKGESLGGIEFHFTREQEIADEIIQCVEIIKKMNKMLKSIYGYECG